MGIKLHLRIYLIIIISMSYASYTFAQAGRGRARLGGMVLDEEGNPIPSARVVLYFIQNEDINREAITDKKGNWSIMALGTGDWRVTASAEGYIPAAKNTYIRQLEKNPKIVLKLKRVNQSDLPVIQDESSLELLEQGNKLFENRKYEEALDVFRKFLELNPKAYQIRLNIGDTYKEKGDIDRAMEEYKVVLEKANQDKFMKKEIIAKALARIGDCYIKKGNLEEAQAHFKKSIEESPENEILPYNVGEIYFSNQKLDEAIYYFKLAAKIKPDRSDPYYKLGLVYLNKADNTEAIKYLDKFLKIEPDTSRSVTVKNILKSIKK